MTPKGRDCGLFKNLLFAKKLPYSATGSFQLLYSIATISMLLFFILLGCLNTCNHISSLKNKVY